MERGACVSEEIDVGTCRVDVEKHLRKFHIPYAFLPLLHPSLP